MQGGCVIDVSEFRVCAGGNKLQCGVLAFEDHCHIEGCTLEFILRIQWGFGLYEYLESVRVACCGSVCQCHYTIFGDDGFRQSGMPGNQSFEACLLYTSPSPRD